MEILARHAFRFIALANDEIGLLSVVCGTSALFEVRLQMPRVQLVALLADDAKLQELTEQVRLSPQRYC